MEFDSSLVSDGLLGISRRRSFLLTGLAFALFLGTYLLGTIARAQGWMSLLDGRLPLLIVFVLVTGVAVAAASAIWNDGLLLSWLLVFGPVLGWLWIVFVQGPVFLDGAIVPIAFAAVAAIVIGTIGYVIGRSRSKHTLDSSEGQGEWPLAVIVGRDDSQRGRWIMLIGALFVLAGGVSYATGPFLKLPIEGVSLFDIFYPTAVLHANTFLGTLVVLGWIGLAMWPAYRGAGLLISWGIVFGPMFGVILTGFVLGETSGVGPLLDTSFAFIAALIFTLILGTGGYLFGTGLRRVISSPESRQLADNLKT